MRRYPSGLAKPNAETPLTKANRLGYGGDAIYDLPILVENEQNERLIAVSVQLLGNNPCVNPGSFIVCWLLDGLRRIENGAKGKSVASHGCLAPRPLTSFELNTKQSGDFVGSQTRRRILFLGS